MRNLYIMGAPGSGKTLLALGLSLKFIQQGFKVAYFKPVGFTSRQMCIRDSNLATAAAGERYEFEEMYPAFVKAAEEENQNAAARVMKLAMRCV